MADVEKIAAELRAGIAKLANWSDDQPAASFRAIPKLTLGDIRALLDELSRLREVERRAKEVTRPFAKYANLACSAVNIPDRRIEVAVYADDDAEITVGHFRKIAKFARALSAQVEERE